MHCPTPERMCCCESANQWLSLSDWWVAQGQGARPLDNCWSNPALTIEHCLTRLASSTSMRRLFGYPLTASRQRYLAKTSAGGSTLASGKHANAQGGHWSAPTSLY
jgi:hypothetical protein